MAGADDGGAALRKLKELSSSGRAATMEDVMKVASALLEATDKKFVGGAEFLKALKIQDGLNRALQREVSESKTTDPDKLIRVERELAKKDLGEALDLMKELAAEARAEIKERDERIAKLERRLEAVEAEPMTYQGTFEVGKYYARGSVVTHRGGMWHCAEGTTTPPDFGAPQWTLCVKSGRDGKDLR